MLQQFYLQLRKHSSADGSPITARQLESLVRLVEARARLELREEISRQDAKVCGSFERNYHPTCIIFMMGWRNQVMFKMTRCCYRSCCWYDWLQSRKI